jgi:TonB family protein
MKYFFTLLILVICTSGFASAEDELNNWLDSTFITHEIDWEKAVEEFKVYTEDHYKKAANLPSFLSQFKIKKRTEAPEKFELNNREDYPHFNHLAIQAAPILKELEAFTIRLILKYKLENDRNEYTRFLIRINHLNHVPLNHLNTVEMKSKSLVLRDYFDLNPEISEKINLMLFAKKIFLENDYISMDALIASISVSQNEDSLQIDSTHNLQDREPAFIGGTAMMNDFVQFNIHYPELAREMGERGIVYVKFVINSKGQIRSVGIRKGISDSIDREAMRIIKMMPLWIPGIHEGKLVSTHFTLPFTFSLR